MGTPYKMKGSPMQRNFGIGSPLRQEDVVAKSDEEAAELKSKGYRKTKGTNIWEHPDHEKEKKASQASEDAIAENAGWTTIHGKRYLKKDGKIDPHAGIPR